MTIRKRQQKEHAGLIIYAFAVYNIISNFSIDKKMFKGSFKDNGTPICFVFIVEFERIFTWLKRKIQYKK